MRRILVIVLLALLPLQFSWSAVANYCKHEAQPGSQHVGHHEHEHHGDAGPVADPASTGGEAPVAFDLDCGHCHGQCPGMPPPSDGMPGKLSAAHPTALADEAGGVHAPTRPERPQWAGLA